MMNNISRRRFLIAAAASAGLGAVSVPLLGRQGLARLAMAPRGDAAKLKIVFIVVPDGLGVLEWNRGINGFYEACRPGGIWHPKVAEGTVDSTSFELNKGSAALEPCREHCLFLDSICNLSGLDGQGGHNGWVNIMRDNTSKLAYVGAVSTPADGRPSIDNILGDALPGANPAISTFYSGPATGTTPNSGDVNNWFVSFTGNGANCAMRSPQDDPRILIESVTGESFRRSQRDRSSVLAPSQKEINEIRSRVFGTERTKLDEHLAGVEQVASEVGAEVPGCTVPAFELPPGIVLGDPEFRSAIHDAHNKIVAHALSCGLTRVSTIQVASSTEKLWLPGTNRKKSAHDIAHWGVFGQGGEAAITDEEDFTTRVRFYAGKVNDFVQLLKDLPDPDVPGSKLIDHTLVVFTSEMADGAPELRYDMPMTLIGGASGLLQSGSGSGRYFDLAAQHDVDDGGNNNDRPRYQVTPKLLWNTIAKAAGVPEPYDGGTLKGIFNNVT